MSIRSIIINTLLSMLISFIVAKNVIPLPFDVTPKNILITGIVTFLILSTITIYRKEYNNGKID